MVARSIVKSALSIAFIITLPTVWAQEDASSFAPPEKPRVTAYSSLWEQSPFTEKEVAVVEEGPGFAENLQLEGVMTLNGEDTALVVDTTTNEVLYIKASEPTKGITLAEVKNRNSLSQLSVVLASGSERSSLGFTDEKLVVGPSATAAKTAQTAAAKQSGQPGQQPAQPPLEQNQQVAAQTNEKTTLTDEQMRERRRQFWEAMRDRRSRER